MSQVEERQRRQLGREEGQDLSSAEQLRAVAAGRLRTGKSGRASCGGLRTPCVDLHVCELADDTTVYMSAAG